MDLVELGKHINEIEKTHISDIKKLNFLGFNIWKIFRNHYCSKFITVHKPNISIRQYLNKDIFSIFKFAKNTHTDIVIRTTAALYNTKKEGQYYSKRIDILKQELKRLGYSVSVIGKVSLHKQGKLYPNIDLALDSAMSFAVLKLKYLFFIFIFIYGYKNYRVLTRIYQISLKSVLSLHTAFFIRYLLFKQFYKLLNPKKVMFTFASYGNEAEIAALKNLDIEIVEYQHGHLYPEHYGYNYNSVLKPLKDKLLLPDKLLVYGLYWKDVLLSIDFFEDKDIIVTGNPNFMDINKIELDVGTKIPILVCSQPNSATIFMNFIENYMANSQYINKYHWVIKLHPREVIEAWEVFVKDKKNIEISNKDTYELLNSINIQVTGSSTTLYEGLFFNVSNYIILNDLKLNDSSNYDDSIGKIISLDYVDKLQYDNNNRGNKYFDNFNISKAI